MANEFFGPVNGIDTKDYLLLMDGQTIISKPEKLVGHTMTSPNVDLSDALNITKVQLKNGRIVTRVVTKRAPEERGRQYTVGFPSGALWTPAMQLALRSGCRKTFYMKYLCPEDVRYNHIDVLPDALLDPLTPEGDLITVDEEVAITYTSTLRIAEQFRLWALGGSVIFDTTNPIETLEFLTVDCPDCDDIPGFGFITGGGDGIAVPTVLKTTDRFTNSSALVTGAAAADYAVSSFTEGGLILIGTADDVSPATALTGEVRVSTDGGATWAAVTGIAVPVWGFAKYGETIIAVGGASGANPGMVWYSKDGGLTFTNLVNSEIPAAAALTGIAVDPETGRFYAIGEAGNLILIEVSGSSFTVVDLSANLDGAPTVLRAVKVLSKDHLAVGGASGYYAESLDGALTSTQMSVGAGATTVRGIAGNRYRTVVVAGNDIFVRSAETEMLFSVKLLENGQVITGDYTAIRENVDRDPNMFALSTDDGEIVLIKPFYPNA